MAEPVLLDETVGRLARWLRLLGYDASLVKGDPTTVYRAARQTGHLLITRNTELQQRPGIQVLTIETDDVDAQLRLVKTHIGEPGEPITPRCAICNTILIPINREVAKGKVPPYVWRNTQTFTQCASCRRIYWPGTHWKTIESQLRDE